MRRLLLFRVPQRYAAGAVYTVLVFPILFFVFTLITQAQQSSNSGTIVGQVRVARVGFASQQMLVTIDRGGAQAGTAYTDGQGRFAFEDLPGNLYHISVREEGYDPVVLSVPLNPSTQRIVYVNIELNPTEKSSDKRAGQASIPGSNPALVDESALLTQFPKAARKEYEKATKLQAEGRKQQALEHYQKALKIAPNMYFAGNNLGSLYVESQQFGEAEVEFRKVITENQADANGYFNLANVYLLTGHLDQALSFVRQGLSRQPRSAWGYFLLGSIMLKLGEQTAAETNLRVALREDPGLANAHLALVNLYMEQRRNEDAVAELTAFLKQSPESSFGPQARELLKKLQTRSNVPH